MLPLKSLALGCAALLPTTALADWTGWYAGGNYSAVTNLSYELTVNVGPDVAFDDGSGYGFFVGSLAQQNNFVFGAEVAFVIPTQAEELEGDATIDYMFDLKVSGGVPVSDILIYGLFSASTISGTYGPNDIDAGGLGFGAGAAFKINQNLSISGEYLSRFGVAEFVETDVEATADTLSLRAAFHF